jgi:hypothetical protein
VKDYEGMNIPIAPDTEDPDDVADLLDADGPVEDDYLTVTLLSAGLAQILMRRKRAELGERNEESLLPPAWRVGFARLWWRCLEEGATAVSNDHALLALCAQPLITWPVELRLSEPDLQHPLLVDGHLSELAEQGARLARVDVEAEWVENRIHEALRSAASANGTTDREVERAYAYLRRYMIDRVVIADNDVRALERRFRAVDGSGRSHVRRLIDTAYRSRPASSPQHYLLCPGCNNVVGSSLSRCSTPGCRGGEPHEFEVAPLAAVFEQHRAARLYIHDPGLVEARIIDALSADDELTGTVRITAYPGVDLLDVLIEFLAADVPDAFVVETWGVDAKDQVSAHLLGRGFTWPKALPCDRRFLALPTHRATQPGYVDDLKFELDGRVKGVQVIDEARLIELVRARAEVLSS